MHIKTKAALQEAIEKMIEAESETNRWPSHIMLGNLIEHMTNAAEVVFDSMVDAAEYAEQKTKTL